MLILAIAVAGAMLVLYSALRVPAHDGVDQNGYLVGGRMLARHGSPAVDGAVGGRPDPFLFAGSMWIGHHLNTPAQRYYPKYPLGMPATYAAAFSMGGSSGLDIAYWISPVSMALALLVSFLLIRRFAGSLAAFLALVALAASPLTLGLANNPNSHALALLLATAGMLAALLWSDGAGLWAAIAAGLLLGFAASVRYTEALFLLPAALGVAWRLSRRHDRADLIAAGSMILSFAAIVGAMLMVNHHWMGTLTGYSATRESAPGVAFRLEHLAANLPAMLEQLHDIALPWILPFALGGLVWLCRGNWRLAALLLAWVVPSILVYSLYYWAPQREGTSVGYLRFVLSTFPAILLCAAWLFSRAQLHAGTRSIATAIAGVMVAAAVLAGLPAGLRLMEADQRHRLMLADNAAHITRTFSAIPANAALFCADRGLLNHLQATLSQEALFDASLFEPGRALRMIEEPDTGRPEGPDPNRRAALRQWLLAGIQERAGQPYDALPRARRGDELQRFLDDQKQSRVSDLLAGGRRVFFIQSSRSTLAPAPVDAGLFRLQTLAIWRPYILPTETSGAGAEMEEAWLPTWRIIEVQTAPPVVAPPATGPATRPTHPSH